MNIIESNNKNTNIFVIIIGVLVFCVVCCVLCFITLLLIPEDWLEEEVTETEVTSPFTNEELANHEQLDIEFTFGCGSQSICAVYRVTMDEELNVLIERAGSLDALESGDGSEIVEEAEIPQLDFDLLVQSFVAYDFDSFLDVYDENPSSENYETFQTLTVTLNKQEQKTIQIYDDGAPEELNLLLSDIIIYSRANYYLNEAILSEVFGDFFTPFFEQLFDNSFDNLFDDFLSP